MMLQNDSSCDGSLDLPSPYCNGGIALVRVQSGICEFGDMSTALELAPPTLNVLYLTK